jgi:hypothetical protein
MTTNDEARTLGALRAAAQARGAEEAADDPRWRALAGGTLSDAERDALHAEAMQSEEGCARWELYRPFDAQERSRLLDGVRRRIHEDRARRRRWARPRDMVVGVAASAMAMAMAAGLYLNVARDPAPAAWTAGWGSTLASGADREPLFTLRDPDDRLQATLRGSADEPLAVRGAALAGAEGSREHRAVDLHETSGDANDFFLGETRKVLFPCVPAGDWKLVVVLGRKGSALSEADVIDLGAKARRHASTGPYRVLEATLRLVGPPTRADGAPCGEGPR